MLALDRLEAHQGGRPFLVPASRRPSNLRPLCVEPVEVEYYEQLMDIAEKLDVNSFQGECCSRQASAQRTIYHFGPGRFPRIRLQGEAACLGNSYLRAEHPRPPRYVSMATCLTSGARVYGREWRGEADGGFVTDAFVRCVILWESCSASGAEAGACRRQAARHTDENRMRHLAYDCCCNLIHVYM